jgi:hypothetical protein
MNPYQLCIITGMIRNTMYGGTGKDRKIISRKKEKKV